MVDFKLAIRSISSYTVDFQLYGRFWASYTVDFPAIWSILSQLYGRFQISYMVDFIPQVYIEQDSIVISYLMDIFDLYKTLYRSIKKAIWFFARLRNLLFLILYLV